MAKPGPKPNPEVAARRIREAEERVAAAIARKSTSDAKKAAKEAALQLAREEKECDRHETMMWQTHFALVIAAEANRLERELGRPLPKMRNVAARNVGTSVQDMSSIFTGMASKKANEIKAGQWWYKPVEEHQYPNQVAGHDLITLNVVPTDDMLFDPAVLDLFKRARMVNWVTAQENRDLVEFQKYGKFTTPEASYADAGIEMEPAIE